MVGDEAFPGGLMSPSTPSVFVVAVAGPPGCGKSSVVEAAAAALGQAAVLAFDDFETLTAASADQMAAWQASGGFAALSVPGLMEALAALRSGEAVVSPSGRRIAAAPLVLFEMPLGRAYPPTRAMIDRLVWIDVPPDVALARALIAICSSEPKPPHAWLVDYLNDYIRSTRTILQRQRDEVAPGADLVLDGTATVAAMAATLVAYIRGTTESH